MRHLGRFKLGSNVDEPREMPLIALDFPPLPNLRIRRE